MYVDNKKDRQNDQQRAIANIRWVSHLNAGGRIQGVSVCSIIGNGKGVAGIGMATGKDTSAAIRKSSSNAKKNMIKIQMKQGRTVHHSITQKYCSTVVLIMPGKVGSGIKCSNTIRLLMNCFGFKDISIKCLSGSRNRINVLRAVIEGLKNISSPQKIAEKRGISYTDLVGHTNQKLHEENNSKNDLDEMEVLA
jgi:small subunit ribosomal protein S5